MEAASMDRITRNQRKKIHELLGSRPMSLVMLTSCAPRFQFILFFNLGVSHFFCCSTNFPTIGYCEDFWASLETLLLMEILFFRS